MTRPARVQRRRLAAVVGIHALPCSKNMGMTERDAGGLAILGALADAGRVCQTDGSAEDVQTGRGVRLRFPRSGRHAAPVLDARVARRR
jgi:hypothetical protein